jgi:hypothetical protein
LASTIPGAIQSEFSGTLKTQALWYANANLLGLSNAGCYFDINVYTHSPERNYEKYRFLRGKLMIGGLNASV